MEAMEEKRLQEVDAPTLKGWMERGEVVLIDVRESAEFAAERIPGARLVPLSTFAPAQVRVEAGKKLVLHCVMGARSAQAGQKLLAAGFGEVYNLREGMRAWKEAGYAIEGSAQKAPSPRRWPGKLASLGLPQQVQIVAGSLVLLSTILGALVSVWFLWLSGVVGAGLLYAGITSTCGLTMLLARLPYNRRA
jgi:rhodanese-related sulfurtransferase